MFKFYINRIFFPELNVLSVEAKNVAREARDIFQDLEDPYGEAGASSMSPSLLLSHQSVFFFWGVNWNVCKSQVIRPRCVHTCNLGYNI